MNRYRPDDLRERRTPGEVLPGRVIDATPLSVVDANGPAKLDRRRFLKDVTLIATGGLVGSVASDRALVGRATQATPSRQGDAEAYAGMQPERVRFKADAEMARLTDGLTDALQHGGVVTMVGVLIGYMYRRDSNGTAATIGRDPILLATPSPDATDADSLLKGGFFGMVAPGEAPGTISVSETDMSEFPHLHFVPDNPARPLRYLSVYVSRLEQGRFQLFAFDPSGSEAISHSDAPVSPGLIIE